MSLLLLLANQPAAAAGAVITAAPSGTTLSSRRDPWPWHVKLANNGLMLVEGSIIGKKTQTLENVAPTEQDYSSAPVYKERTFPFRPLRGMGERLQSSHADQRYRYAINVQVVGGLAAKGPLTHTIMPTTTGSIRQFIEALNGGTLSQFILAGQNVLVRNNDTNAGQAVSETRAGQTATSAVRFKSAGAGPVDALYVAWSDGVLRQYNGTVWASAVLPSGFAPQFLEVVRDEFWAAGGNQARKVQSDPMVAANWSAAFTIGDASSNITAIKQTQNQLYFFKDDGRIFTIDNTSGAQDDILPGNRTTPDPTNGRTVAAWLDSLWYRVGQSFYELGGGIQQQIGPERLLDNDSEVRGPVQAFAGWGTVTAFASLYNAALGNSYLLTYGTWQVPSERADDQYHFVPQWDGALVRWTGKQVTAMMVSSIASPDTRLYVGFADGSWDWIKLVPNPLAPSSGAEFTLATAEMYPPLHTAMFESDWKVLMGVSGFGPVLTAQDTLQVAYRVDGSTLAYTTMAGVITAPGMRLDAPAGVQGHVLDLKITLSNATTADTPVIQAVAIHEKVSPNLRRDYSMSVDARDHVAKLDGSTDRKSGQQVRDIVYQAAGAPGAVTMVMPDETVSGLTFFGYQERLLPRKQSGALGWAIDVVATEFKTLTIYGTFDRFRGVTFNDLSEVTFEQLRTW